MRRASREGDEHIVATAHAPSTNDLEDQAVRADRGPRRPYRAPRLVAYGSLRGLTLGGFSTPGDSGGGLMVKVFFNQGYRELP